MRGLYIEPAGDARQIEHKKKKPVFSTVFSKWLRPLYFKLPVILQVISFHSYGVSNHALTARK